MGLVMGMAFVIRMQVRVRCPSCGETGTVTIASGERDGVGIRSASDGFYVRLTPDNSMQVACVECATPAHEDNTGSVNKAPDPPQLSH